MFHHDFFLEVTTLVDQSSLEKIKSCLQKRVNTSQRHEILWLTPAEDK